MKKQILILNFLFLTMTHSHGYEKLFEPTPVGEIEIKTIPAVLIAEVDTPQDYFEGDNGLFGRLFRYIQKNDISMTTPVEAEMEPGQMRFFIASSQTEKADFDDSDIEVYERKEQKVVSVGLRGSYNQERYDQGLQMLETWLETNKQWVATGGPVGVYWNGPFTFPFLKKSEVYIPIAKVEESKNILMVLTSYGEMEDGKPTGLWLEEFSIPHAMFVEAGYEVTIASVEGGKVPVDPRSVTEETKPENHLQALELLENTQSLSGIDAETYAAVFFPGGHGTMFDLPGNKQVQHKVRSFIEAGKPSAFVCHGPAALVGVTGTDGESIVKGRRLTGFTNEEEEAVNLTDEMPFLLESRLKELGAEYAEAANFQVHVIVDGNLITGQNPASSKEAAQAVLDQLD